MPPPRSLHICYFGLREPLVQTQVLPYLRELAGSGVAMSLLTFERERFDETAWREQLRGDTQAEHSQYWQSFAHDRPPF